MKSDDEQPRRRGRYATPVALHDFTAAFLDPADRKAAPYNLSVGTGLTAAPTTRSELVFGHNQQVNSTRFAAGAALRQLEAYAGRATSIDWLVAGLDLIGKTAAQAPWNFVTTDGKTLPNNRQEAAKSERLGPKAAIDLIEAPNPWMGWDEMVSLMLIDWHLTGDTFWLKFDPDASGAPEAMFRLNPGWTEVLPDPSGEQLIGGYRYHVPGQQPVYWAPEDIFHWKRANPHDARRGVGIVQAAARTMDQELALVNTKASYYENGARLSGVLESDHAINDGVIMKLRRQFTGMYSGTDASYRVAVLERGLKYKEIGNNAAEAEFGPMSDQSRERILAMLGVPSSLLFVSVGKEVRGNIEEDRRNFANITMRPLLSGMAAELTQQVFKPAWGVSFEINYEYQMPIEAQIELATNFGALPGVKISEVRDFAGLEPLGDERDDIVLNLPGENDNESEVKDRNLGPEAGRPPKGENTAEVPASGNLPKDATARTEPGGKSPGTKE